MISGLHYHRSPRKFAPDSSLEGRVRSELVSKMGFFEPGNYDSIPRVYK